MKNIIISPFSRAMRNGKQNPKNYPYWKDVVNQLQLKSCNIIQVGIGTEESIDANEFKKDLSLQSLRELLLSSDAWASVDNFFNHFATFYQKRGVVIFSRSDPSIFGYDQNINLIKDRKFLRQNQFETWEQDAYNQASFVDPDCVVSAIQSLIEAS